LLQKFGTLLTSSKSTAGIKQGLREFGILLIACCIDGEGLILLLTDTGDKN